MLNTYIQTLKETLNTPRNVVDAFIHSREQESRWQHPFLFCTIGVLFYLIVNLFFIDFSFETAPPQTDGGSEELHELALWIEVATIRVSTQFLPLSMLTLLIPMLSLPGIFFFREQMEGFYANLILNTYTTGASLLAFLVLIPAWSFLAIPLTDSAMHTTLPAIAIAAVGLWVYKNYFRPAGFIGWTRILSSFITGYILFIFVKGFIAGVIGYMLFAINRIMELSGG